MENKSVLQQQEFAYLKDKHRVILRWATGVGKSKQTIDLVNNASSSFPKAKMLLVVGERSHFKNWEEEFEKWGLNKNIEVKIICYASLHKVKSTAFDIMVLDEAHHAFTEKRLSSLETISADYIFLLSATLSVKKIVEIESIYGKFAVSTVSLKEAVEKDILPDPRVVLIKMHLDNTKVNQILKIGNAKNPPVVEWKDRKKYIYKGKACMIKCTELQKYQYYTEKMEYWKRRYELTHNQFHHNAWVSLGSQRKRFLGELKTKKVKSLISGFTYNKRYICFCASVKQAEELGKGFAITSKQSSKKNQETIDAFNKGELSKLYAVGMATEGLNLANIQVGIIVQLDGKERLFIQKFGRALRAEHPTAYIFYYDNTQDEKYLKNAIENIDSKFIVTINTL